MTVGKAEILSRATGRPGSAPRWSSGSKVAVGTSRSDTSLVWFTISRGVLNEIFYPRIDSPCLRDAFFIVTGPDGFFSDERVHASHDVQWMAPGVPGFDITTTCSRGHYRLEKAILTDDRLNTVLEKVRFTALRGEPKDYLLHVYLNPHVAGEGAGNTSWIEEFKGQTTLFAQRGDVHLAVACSTHFLQASTGFVGKSDGLEDLESTGRLSRQYQYADDGNVALIGQIDLSSGSEFTLAIGFGLGFGEAAHHAWGGLHNEFSVTQDRYVRRWEEWHQSLVVLDGDLDGGRDLYRPSMAMLLAHANKSTPGAVASLAIPWGEHRGDEDILQGAYHMVWPRDLVNHGGALIAGGARSQTEDLLEYLRATQEADGHWPQNMWVSGIAFWDGIQTDQTAVPVLAADLALREGFLERSGQRHYWPMIRRAVGYLMRYGASTELDRWEDATGYNAYTLSSTIAALLVAADWADAAGEQSLGTFLRQTADSWNACIEGWLYVRHTDLTRQLNIDGYYARIVAPDAIVPSFPGKQYAEFHGTLEKESQSHPRDVVSVDALALVRFGLRSADDPRIVNTVKAIDATLKIETPRGPVWRRYLGDQFGEHPDGSPFKTSNKGVGRGWPLLVGERAHYELARGDITAARDLCRTMAAFACDTGLISEQVWDSPDIPTKRLFAGEPTGSAMPLLWAHAEYVKLRRSLRDKQVFDRPAQTTKRYTDGRTDPIAIWRPDHPCESILAGTALRVEATDGAKVRWKVGEADWQCHTPEDGVLDILAIEHHPKQLPAGTVVQFQVFRPTADGQQQESRHSLTVR